MAIRRESLNLPSEIASKPAIARSEPIPAPRKAYPPYGLSIKALVARVMDQKRAQGMSAAQVAQISKVYALFNAITGARDTRQLKQTHIAQLVHMLRRLPPTYR